MSRSSRSVTLYPPQPLLVLYEAMCSAIAKAHAVDEVKDIRDKAAALEAYARQAQNLEAEQQAREIRLRAERRRGQLISALEKAKGGRPRKNPLPESRSFPRRTLSDLRIKYRQSSDWQKMARVPDEPFELAVREPQATTKGILRLLPREAPPPDRVVSLDTWTSASSARIEPPNDAELRELALYEGLRALDRASWSTDDPLKLLATLPDDTRDDIAAIARRCAPWLSRIAETRRRRHGAVNR